MPVIVRAATASDAAQLATLNAHVHGLHVAARPDFFRDAPRDEVVLWLASLAEGGNSRIWLAEGDGAPVGYVLIFFHERPARPFTHARRWCEIDQVALGEARRRGIRDIELSSWAFNTDARGVFERLGFTPKVIRFERMLGQGA
jgi:RimJ/RimL family protein N-acetyltransferase